MFRDILLVLIGFYIYSHLSNPHLVVSVTRKNFTKYFIKNSKICCRKIVDPVFLPYFFSVLSLIRESYLIISRLYFIDKLLKLRRKNYDSIYQKIIKKRFKKNLPYLIAGDHFSSFYPRNLGFFYSKALDTTTCIDIFDYQNRLILYLNSLEFVLNFFKSKPFTTTISPVYGRFFVALNFFRKPSDTLCSILLALDYLISPLEYFGDNLAADYQNVRYMAKDLAIKIFNKNYQNLKNKIIFHLNYIDPDTGLIKKDLSLSGIRDGVIRKSSFYENIVTYKTIVLGIKMGLIFEKDLLDYQNPKNLKKNIIKNFFKKNFILSELDDFIDKKQQLSIDFLIVLQTNFFDFNIEKERIYFKKIIDFVLKSDNWLTSIGPMYSPSNHSKTVFLVKLLANDYMGKSVWSHWSCEFCMSLLKIYDFTKEQKYLSKAKEIIKNLEKKILFYKGYPELYNQKLKIYQTLFYSSMIDTGWIVNYQFLKQKIKKI